MTFTIATANLGNHRVPGLAVASQSRRVAQIIRQADPDVICVQEGRRGLVAPKSHRVIRFPALGCSELPIVVRRGIELRGSGSTLAHAGKRGVYPAKGFTWLDLDGIGFVGNLHLVSHTELRGVPRPDSERAAAAYLNLIEARRVVVTMPRLTGPSFVAGDLNVDLEADRRERHPRFPAAWFHTGRLVDALGGPATLGDRNVDRVLYNVRTVQEPIRVRVLDRVKPFDHRVKVVTFPGGRP